jgi:proteasome lid subunit RPN8/RPN11
MQTQDKDKTRSLTEEKPKPIINKVPAWPVGLRIPANEMLTVSIAEDLAVILTKEAFEQLFCWAYSTYKEISCLGSVHRDGNRFFIEKFYLLKQSGCSACTEIDQEAIAELIEKLMAEGKAGEAQSIKCWAHSHPNMEAFWSNTDRDTCSLLVNDYLISIVVANNFAIRCRIDIAAPVPIALDNVPVFYAMPKDELSMQTYAEQVRNMVSDNLFALTRNDEKRNKQKDEEQSGCVQTHYCGYCGYFHADGECPLDDSEAWANIDDEDFML